MRSIGWDMDALAVNTWRRICAGDQRHIRLREDTITELNLLDLATSHPEVVVHRFNQNAERTSGADWEWYIGSGSTWFCLRIQAKRMDGLEYRQLQHEGDRADDYQYDTLISSSSSSRPISFPYYVFFNGWEQWPVGVDWHGCPGGVALDRCVHASAPDFGCSALPARLVRAIHAGRGAAGRKVAEYLPYSVPWSWLFPADYRRSPMALSRTLNLRANRPHGSSKTIHEAREHVLPEQWGALGAAPPSPTLEDTYRWHRAINEEAAAVDAMSRQERARWLDGDRYSGSRGMWERILDRWHDLPDTDEGLAPLPTHAAILRDLQQAGGDSDEIVDHVEAQLGSRPLTVVTTELPRRRADEPAS